MSAWIKNPPKFVTFTGVDEHTSTLGLQLLSEAYPVEWGVLFSPDRQGKGRYPPLHAVRNIASLPRLRLAAHLCGRYADEFIETGGVADLADLMLAFPRIQVNTARKDVDHARLAAFGREYHAQVILQCRGEFPSSREVTWLFDASGGRAIMPASWPIAPPAILRSWATQAGWAQRSSKMP
jgi:hypothetical protein